MVYSIEALKKMNINELEELAIDIRKTLITSISKTGGHLASNLGIVELTIALHYVFNSPRDLIFFDVSHQTYVHKLLTGRSDEFSTLRAYQGLSGFAKKSESIHDIFESGHSSTSISAALGYLEVKENNPTLFDDAVVVIGDASIVNGVSMEALNYLGSKPNHKMIIILNDNEMGVSKNVGGLAKTFNNIRIKGKFKLLRKIFPRSIKRMMKSVAYKNNFLSGLGIKYLGLIDGHNIKELIEYFEYAKKSPTSVILHVKTCKGKGYRFSEEDKTGVWHSTPPFDIDSGLPLNKKDDNLIFGIKIAEYLSNYNQQNPNKIKVITPGMAYGSGLEEFQSLNKNDFIDVGIGEENAVMMSSSIAEAGMVPVTFIYSTFLQRAYDELINDLARNNCHSIICVDRAGIVDGDGPTHQGIYDVAYLSTIPNLNILMPRNINEAIKMISYCLNNPAPYVIRYPKEAYKSNEVDDFILGKWSIIRKSKNNKYIISYGPNLDLLLNNIDDEVGLINAKCIKPFDEEMITNLLKNNNKLYFYEEVVANNCLASQVINFANQLFIDKTIPLYHISSKTLPNSYLVQGSKLELLDLYQINIKKFLKEVEGD